MNDTSKNVLINEQEIMNKIINKFPISHTRFPNEIWALSNKPMPNTKSIILHHANCTVYSKTESSLQMKLKQLQFIKELVIGTIGYRV